MPLANWTYVPVYCNGYGGQGGTVPVGAVRFESAQVVIVNGQTVAFPEPLVFPLDASGNLSCMVPANDDPNILPTYATWQWLVTEDFDGGRPPYLINVPIAQVSTGINLATVIPVYGPGTAIPSPSGPAGPPNVLAVRNVTKIAPGGTPTFVLSGASPGQTIDVGLVTGDTGAQGIQGIGGNGVLTTIGAPASSFGNDGDYAFDYTAQTMYGPKSGTWPAGIKLAPTYGDYSVASNFQRAIANISNPDTRYDVTVVGSAVEIDLRQAAIMLLGTRLQNIFRRPSRVYSVQGSFDASGSAVTVNSGVTLGFDPGTGTGANVLFNASASSWTWRSDGNVVGYNLNTGASDASIAYTRTSGSATTFVAGDIVRLELTEDASSAGTLRGYKNGTLVFTGTVLAIPQGRMVAGFRGIGTGGAYPNAQRFTVTSVSTTDLIAQSVTSVTVTNPIGNVITTPGLPVGSLPTPVDDPNAYLTRVAPSGFEWLPMTPQIVARAGDVRLNTTVLGAIFQRYPAIAVGGLSAYVSTTGNDSTASVGNPNLPFLTLSAAAQSAATLIIVNDGAYAPLDYKFNQAAAGTMKVFMAMNPGRAIIRTPGDSLAANTWSAVGGYSGMYSTPIASASGLSAWLAGAPHHVRLTDTLDSYGFPARLQNFPAANTGAVAGAQAALFAAGTGFVWDGTLGVKTLYVMLGGQNVQANRARLQALYYSAAATDRIFIQGAGLVFEGFYIDGPAVWADEYNNSGTYIPASGWFSNSWLINSTSYAVEGDSNCLLVVDKCRIHAPFQDGVNSDSTRNGSGATARASVTGCFITRAGDVDTQGTGVSQNRQAISIHSGYGFHAGNVYEQSWGQERADTASGSGPSATWELACVARNGDTRIGSARTGFGFYAGPGSNRTVNLDTCFGLNEGANALYLQDAGGFHVVSKTFNCTFDQPIVRVGGAAAPIPYTPDSP
jgi:hypothetical protein